MKTTLELKQRQHMTQQLQQAMRLLQLSRLELAQEIQQIAEVNPLLEIEEEEFVDLPSDSEEEYNNEEIPEDLPIDANWEDVYEQEYKSTTFEDEDNLLETRNACKIDFKQEIYLQLEFAEHLTDIEYNIAQFLIEALDYKGYLSIDLEEIASAFENTISQEEIMHTLDWLQSLEPAGIGARNLQECLLLQLKRLDKNVPYLQLATTLVSHYLEKLAQADFTFLRKKLQAEITQIQEAIVLIQSLQPYPIAAQSSETDYIIPDVIIYKHENIWHIELNHNNFPKVKLNNYYIKLLRQNGDGEYLRGHLQEARWLMDSIQHRNETLFKVTQALIMRQKNFLEYGEEAMQPLVMRTIAEDVGVHESTISRATQGKYIQTPRGTLPFKYFFSSQVNTNNQGEQACSATAIQALIKKWIQEEDVQHPLSDATLVNLLAEQNIKVARRTIAKYRENLGISAAHIRKRNLNNYKFNNEIGK